MDSYVTAGWSKLDLRNIFPAGGDASYILEL